MSLTATGFQVFTQIDEFGNFVDGTDLTGFGEYYEAGGNQNFDLLANSLSDATLLDTINNKSILLATSISNLDLIPLLSAVTSDLLATSVSNNTVVLSIDRNLYMNANSVSGALLNLFSVPSYSILTANSLSEALLYGTSSNYTSILGNSLSNGFILLNNPSKLILPATSVSNALTTLIGDGNITTNLLANSLSNSITSIIPKTYSILSSTSVSNSNIILRALSKTNLKADNGSYCTASLQGDGGADLGVFYSRSYSNSSTPLKTGNIIRVTPLTEEGFNTNYELDEFGHTVINVTNDLTETGHYVFYTAQNGVALRANSISSTKARLRYQFYKQPYVIIETYPYVTIDFDITDEPGTIFVETYDYAVMDLKY